LPPRFLHEGTNPNVAFRSLKSAFGGFNPLCNFFCFFVTHSHSVHRPHTSQDLMPSGSLKESFLAGRSFPLQLYRPPPKNPCLCLPRRWSAVFWTCSFTEGAVNGVFAFSPRSPFPIIVPFLSNIFPPWALFLTCLPGQAPSRNEGSFALGLFYPGPILVIPRVGFARMVPPILVEAGDYIGP